jgi:hypothetical protein
VFSQKQKTMANDDMKHRRLQELGESDFEIVDGQPDIRGWDVKNAAGETIGEVEELILDAQTRKVRYMVVELDDDALNLDEDRKVLIPIGIAQLHEDDDDVLLPNVSVAQLTQLPEYDEDHLDDEVERSISTVLGRSAGTATGVSGSDDFYAHDHFNEAICTSAGSCNQTRAVMLAKTVACVSANVTFRPVAIGRAGWAATWMTPATTTAKRLKKTAC